MAQLRCAMEVSPVPPGVDLSAGQGVPVAFEYRDALTGALIGRREVAQLAPAVRVAGTTVQPEAGLDQLPDLGMVRGNYPLPAGAFSVRVNGSVRYYGCAAELDAEGSAPRRVVISLIPRARDVAIQVSVRRGDSVTRLPAEGVAGIEVRPDAAVEREAEVHAGRCSGEPSPPGQSLWCVRALGADPAPTALAVNTPGLGIVRIPLDPAAGERVVSLTAAYEGAIAPTATVRLGGGISVLGAVEGTFHASLEVAAPSHTLGTVCPSGLACVRPVVHVGLGLAGYVRDTDLVGPGSLVSPDGHTSGTLATLEVGAGLLVIPPGAGDRFRATLLVSGLAAGRGDERDSVHGNQLLSPASTVLGGAAELVLGLRLFEGLLFNAGARAGYLPAVGSRGRQFSYLGNATTATDTAALVQVALVFGLGLEL